ncbi:DUF2877 domain-containing protein [Bacillus sp. S3]|uniref:DUF2877 domain-containing protein n=1 Tax=Bacillus sp. S3 TaxID=486398 RepID=UPI00118A0B1F|nr:DUF2877 domain-containing protein [Bacillus sp. S3]QCJ42229.1 DUF2877 domain-containing protein [Bacillus sp. S3]
MRETISGDVEFIKRITHSSFSGFVHSTFYRTFNIQCLENGELFTIACSEIDNGPNTLIIDVDHVSFLGIEVNDRVFVKNQTLHIENKLALSIEKASKWESVIPVYPPNVEILIRNIRRMKEYIDMYGKSGGFKKQMAAQGPFEAEMSKMLEKRKNLLLNELENNHVSLAIPHAVSLIGLGPGLTPSGDDFLTGIFTVFNMKNSPFYAQRSFCEDVLKHAKTLTNDISYMALKKAATGKVRESIISLIESLIAGNEEDLFLSLNKVLSIGSSSGTDISLGLVCGLETKLKAGGKL